MKKKKWKSWICRIKKKKKSWKFISVIFVVCRAHKREKWKVEKKKVGSDEVYSNTTSISIAASWYPPASRSLYLSLLQRHTGKLKIFYIKKYVWWIIFFLNFSNSLKIQMKCLILFFFAANRFPAEWHSCHRKQCCQINLRP